LARSDRIGRVDGRGRDRIAALGIRYHSPALEPWWIGLAAAWWLSLGWLLRTEHPTLGRFTLLLGVAATIDFVLTALNAPWSIYALGGFKGPLTIAWSFWVGLSLLRDRPWDQGREEVRSEPRAVIR
jgi:hypothetical protein